MPESSSKGIEGGRAAFAYECASKAKDQSYKEKYKSHVKEIPVFIKTNGLGQTFAFVNSKKNSKDGEAYKLIYDQTSEWLSKNGFINSNDDMVKQIISKASLDYRQLTIEVISLFVWLRRFADGLIEGDSKNV